VHGFTPDGTSNPGPCHTNCTNNNEVYGFHTGGAMHGFSDGSGHFIKASMTIRLFVKLVTRSGDDVVPSSDLLPYAEGRDAYGAAPAPDPRPGCPAGRV